MRDRLKSAQTRAHSVAVLLLFKVLYTCFLVGCWHVSYPTEIASAFLGLRLPWWQHFLPDRTWLDRGPRGPVLGQPWCRSTWGETVTVFVSHRGLVTVHGAEEQREAACGGCAIGSLVLWAHFLQPAAASFEDPSCYINQKTVGTLRSNH